MNNRKAKKQKSTASNNENVVIGFLEKIWSAIRRFKFYALAILILTGIPAYYSIVDHQEEKKTEDEIVLDSLYKNFSIVEQTFHPEKISVQSGTENDSILYLIKNYKQLSCELAVLLKELYSTPSITEFSNSSIPELTTLLESYNEKRGIIDEKSDSITDLIFTIEKYGKDHNIKSFVVNRLMYNKLSVQKKQADKYSEALFEKAKKTRDENTDALWNYKDDNKGILMEMLAFMENSWNNLYENRFNNMYFEFLINQNKNYDLELKKRK